MRSSDIRRNVWLLDKKRGSRTYARTSFTNSFSSSKPHQQWWEGWREQRSKRSCQHHRHHLLDSFPPHHSHNRNFHQRTYTAPPFFCSTLYYMSGSGIWVVNRPVTMKKIQGINIENTSFLGKLLIWWDWKRLLERREETIVWETAFGILCFLILFVNIGFCLFDNEH